MLIPLRKKHQNQIILSDFGLQIKTLEKKLNSDKNHIKLLRENQHKFKKAKFIENSSLIAGCSNTKVRNVDLLKILKI